MRSRLTVGQTVLAAALVHLVLAVCVAWKFDWNISGLIRMNAGSARARSTEMIDGMVVLTQSTGFDGKESYFVAVDPFPDRDYKVPYRLKRILYPFAAHVLAFGHRTLLPWTMFLVNYAAILLGTFFLARLLADAGRPPVLALIYGVSIGEITGLKYSLTSPLALALAVAGIFAWRRGRAWVAAACFALSLLSNEYTLVIPLALAAAAFLQGRRRHAIVLAASLLPWVAYLVYIVTRYTAHAVSDAAEVFDGPFQGVMDIIRHIDTTLPWRKFVYSDLAPLIFLVILVIIAATQAGKLKEGILAPFPLLILYYFVFAVFLKEDCWRIINISRYLSPVFPLMMMSWIERESRLDRLCIAASLLFSLAAVAGVVVEPRVPFAIWPLAG